MILKQAEKKLWMRHHPTGVVDFGSEVQGVQEKLCFFIIFCNPSIAYIAVRALQSSQRNVSVQSLLLVIFCTPNSSRVLARERWQTCENSWKKIGKRSSILRFKITFVIVRLGFIHHPSSSKKLGPFTQPAQLCHHSCCKVIALLMPTSLTTKY